MEGMSLEENTNYNIGSNEIDYTPEFVDIEGLQGINSSQGMERFTCRIQMEIIWGLCTAQMKWSTMKVPGRQ